MKLVKVYHPETEEVFEVPEHIADRLRLDEGWLSQVSDPTAVHAVQTVPVEPREPLEVQNVDEPDDKIFTDRRNG